MIKQHGNYEKEQNKKCTFVFNLIVKFEN